jgi:hypothetical protein
VERTQISLEEEQLDLLRRLARARGVSMAHLIRDAVDLAYGSVVGPPAREELWDRALSTVGIGRSDGAPVSEEHDRHLDEIYDS